MTLSLLIDILQMLSLLITVGLFVIKPFRRWFLDQRKEKQEEEAEKEQQKEIMRCLLRDAILRIYNEHKNEKSLHQFDYQNLSMLYAAYKARGGNSFVDHIWSEVQDEWDISP